MPKDESQETATAPAEGTEGDVAPDSVAAEAPSPAAEPEAEPKPTTLRDRLAEARKRVDEGGSLADLASESEEPETAAAEESEHELPPRDEKGRFTKPEAEGGEEETEETAVEEGAPEAEAEQVAAGEEETSEEEAEEAETVSAPETVRLRGRRPEDPDLEIEVDDPQIAERIRQNVNEGMRRDEFNRAVTELQQIKSEFEAVEVEIQADPVGFILESVPAETKTMLARHLLAEDEVFEAIQEDIRNFEFDPTKRDARKTELELDRVKAERGAEETRTLRRNVHDQARTASRTLEGLISGNGLDDRQADRFFRFGMREVGRQMTTRGIREITPEEVIRFLDEEGVLANFGIDPSKRATLSTDARTATARAPDSSAASKASEDGRAVEAQRVGARLKEASERRRAAAATAPAGAGAAPVRHEFPKGQGVKERINEAKRRGASLFGR